MDIKIGDEIAFYPNSGYGGHLAHIIVEKVNKKSFSGTESNKSYQPGKKWRIHKNSSFCFVVREPLKCVQHIWVN